MSEQALTGVVGTGGRELEIGRALAASGDVDIVYFFGGNAGMDEMPRGMNIPDISSSNYGAIVDFAAERDLFVVLGPEQPIVDGLGERLRERGLSVFAPSPEAGRLESSKAWAVEFMRQHGIPHPASFIARSAVNAADYMRSKRAAEYVIKADGLAGGKGAFLEDSDEEAEQIVYGLMSGDLLKGAGKTIVFQERLHGPEASAFVISDGENWFLIPYISQDHKRLEDGDTGAMTGGVGAYAPVPETVVNARQLEKIKDIAAKTIEGMQVEGKPYVGALYLGLMMAEEYDGDPMVIEYNVRFGDPEAEVVLPLLERSGVNIYNLLRSASDGELDVPTHVRAAGQAALTVCLSANGYPEAPVIGEEVYGLRQDRRDVIVHHAGTKLNADGRVVTSGGRSLFITGFGETPDEAAARAYAAIDFHRLGPDSDRIGFKDMQFRRDIG
ncbi:MAG TPA: phosphoribosylamine--glycine ligase, partial [Patescibacteria group bacterium]|nr:phosphoribosylamine--glycine ligase [Patescibacteria group bacterium]